METFFRLLVVNVEKYGMLNIANVDLVLKIQVLVNPHSIGIHRPVNVLVFQFAVILMRFLTQSGAHANLYTKNVQPNGRHSAMLSLKGIAARKMMLTNGI